MNLSPEWENYLVQEGFETRHWSSIGNPQAPDKEIFQWAAEQGQVILTGDLDFGIMLVMSRRREPSVVQIRSAGTLLEDIGPQVLKVLTTYQSELLHGALVTITETRIRMRVLGVSD